MPAGAFFCGKNTGLCPRVPVQETGTGRTSHLVQQQIISSDMIAKPEFQGMGIKMDLFLEVMFVFFSYSLLPLIFQDYWDRVTRHSCRNPALQSKPFKAGQSTLPCSYQCCLCPQPNKRVLHHSWDSPHKAGLPFGAAWLDCAFAGDCLL